MIRETILKTMASAKACDQQRLNRHSADLHSRLKPKSFTETLRLGGLMVIWDPTPGTRFTQPASDGLSTHNVHPSTTSSPLRLRADIVGKMFKQARQKKFLNLGKIGNLHIFRQNALPASTSRSVISERFFHFSSIAAL
ncbi:uncharacterized protein G2W53_027356 [Senna tora]|uniref:Uncharacterized protein n=1 Tax=Senna tora TaxID=362788 RepID=A0A834WJS1_9FABA|nr:uncharacterized protein G2W53_027356 [Senna tora]